MTIGLVGRKSGMTRVFTEDGVSIPVTVVEVTPNRVTQIKEIDSDGYRAIQVTAGSRKASRVSKSQAGQFAKAGVEAGRGLWEFRLGDADEAPAVGSELTVERFAVGQKVDVAGKSKGKGFQGVIKRWNFSMQVLRTVTRVHTALPALLVRTRPPGEYGRAKRCPVTWVLRMSPPRAWKLSVLMSSEIYCLSRALYLARPAVT
jgi:large subunit ribosomal protein L3